MARISDFKEENQVFVPELVIQEASEAINKVVPAKSKQLYEKEYSNFCEWRKRKDAKGVDERIILAYISERSKNAKSSSLWAYYSQLKKMLSVKENIVISSSGEHLPECTQIRRVVEKSPSLGSGKAVTQTNGQVTPYIRQQCGHQFANRRRSEVQRRLDKLNRPVPTKAVFIVCRFLTNNF
ncbi:hypothetical protein TcasGA2_TC002818 [Tribolium castaneum]|uniref:Uncharacterized protein n=1 Tax=Tribolium castaneum TaxID=7070 RepID=D6WIA2_TRICA|nr:hypothetical protein TcasGA2_TC002818 [Tribolium castaneum]